MWFGPTQARTIAEQAQQIVADLIVDYGVTTRSHRHCLFDPVYTAIGIANGEHASLGSTVILELAARHDSRAADVTSRLAQGPLEIEMLPEVREGVPMTRWDLGECRHCGQAIACGEVRETIMADGEIRRHHMQC
jgi:hypothetical protein